MDLLHEYALCIPKQICFCVFFSMKWLNFLSRHCLLSKVTALSVCGYGTECTFSHPDISTVKFLFFSPQNAVVSFQRAFCPGDNSPLQWSQEQPRSSTAGQQKEICLLRYCAQRLWQTERVLASPCFAHVFSCWIIVEATNQNQVHFTLQTIQRVWERV